MDQVRALCLINFGWDFARTLVEVEGADLIE
jgi:hypothetical protein